VISPTERTADSHNKVRVYLRNGTREVWQFFPKSGTAQIHRAVESRLIEPDQDITSDLLTGFVLRLASLFEH
jgi:Uma2 family endonuclease